MYRDLPLTCSHTAALNFQKNPSYYFISKAARWRPATVE